MLMNDVFYGLKEICNVRNDLIQQVVPLGSQTVGKMHHKQHEVGFLQLWSVDLHPKSMKFGLETLVGPSCSDRTRLWILS